MAAPPPPLSREIELKLQADASSLLQVLAALGDEGAPETLETLRATYFDTPDQTLRRAGLSLRLREEGRRRVQTIKARDPDASLLERGEWEGEVDGEAPDFALAEGTPLAGLLTDEVREAIRPLFRAEIERAARMVTEGRSRIELVVDRGEVIAEERRAPVAELELELKEGEPADLFRLARRLTDAAPLRLALATKSERGYALLDGAAPAARRAEQAVLDPAMTSGAAFQAIARACLRHVVANEAVLRATRDADVVHQMRVGLRRLRAALSLFKPILEDAEFDGIRTSLRSMAGALGAARDLDVFISGVLEPALAREPDDAGLAGLAADYRRRRDRVYDEVLAAVDSPGFARGLIGALAWVEGGPWLAAADTAEARETPIGDGAARILDRRWRRVRRRGKGLARMEAAERHQVRIEVKKLRYAVEFFGGLYRGDGAKGRRRAMLEALQDLQAGLGDLNDIAVGATLAGAPAEGGAEAEALARLIAHQGSRADHLLTEARAAWRAFKKAEPFWE